MVLEGDLVTWLDCVTTPSASSLIVFTIEMLGTGGVHSSALSVSVTTVPSPVPEANPMLSRVSSQIGGVGMVIRPESTSTQVSGSVAAIGPGTFTTKSSVVSPSVPLSSVTVTSVNGDVAGVADAVLEGDLVARLDLRDDTVGIVVDRLHDRRSKDGAMTVKHSAKSPVMQRVRVRRRLVEVIAGVLGAPAVLAERVDDRIARVGLT